MSVTRSGIFIVYLLNGRVSTTGNSSQISFTHFIVEKDIASIFYWRKVKGNHIVRTDVNRSYSHLSSQRVWLVIFLKSRAHKRNWKRNSWTNVRVLEFITVTLLFILGRFSVFYQISGKYNQSLKGFLDHSNVTTHPPIQFSLSMF